MTNNYTIIISDIATQMLIAHSRFLAQISEKAALNLINEFKTATSSLAQFPDRNPYLIDDNLPFNKYKKMLICKRYLLLYQIQNNIIYIDYVVDCKQNYKWLL